jgi:hypothetical protein
VDFPSFSLNVCSINALALFFIGPTSTFYMLRVKEKTTTIRLVTFALAG